MPPRALGTAVYIVVIRHPRHLDFTVFAATRAFREHLGQVANHHVKGLDETGFSADDIQKLICTKVVPKFAWFLSGAQSCS